jgi:hypothetical protein
LGRAGNRGDSVSLVIFFLAGGFSGKSKSELALTFTLGTLAFFDTTADQILSTINELDLIVFHIFQRWRGDVGWSKSGTRCRP